MNSRFLLPGVMLPPAIQVKWARALAFHLITSRSTETNLSVCTRARHAYGYEVQNCSCSSTLSETDCANWRRRYSISLG